jgi:hypothetical protein
MELSFVIEMLSEVCSEIRIHPVLAQFEEQLLDLVLM